METPEYDMYEDDTTEGTCPKAPPEELEPTPDAVPDHYLNTSVLLPRGDKFSQENMIGWKRDHDDNPIGRANAQPLLDTRRYEVEFGDGEITKLTENLIVESMYAQVDSELSDTFMMDCMVDYRRNEHALTIQDQNIVVKGGP